MNAHTLLGTGSVPTPVYRVGEATRTDGRTDGLTNVSKTREQNLTSLNARASEEDDAAHQSTITVADHDTRHSHRSRIGATRHHGPVHSCKLCARVRATEGAAPA